MHPFRRAVEARDVPAIEELLAEDVVFHSPVAFAPYHGKAMTAAIIRGAMRVLEDFRYVREIGDPDGRDHALVFEARIGDKRITGCDFLHSGEDGRIDEFMVMVRPLSGVEAFARAMGAEFDRIAREAGAQEGAGQ
ncbi:nuclear transport factor 2 family protein [Nocardia alni]|uniref:nuclear transport factor 2 family protein n=1 Tax=Nocardia alni TaxID=2815723 RepID=UPI001C2467E7|nr:nuclear transport factor 2 family protein [Nocardia alni]